MDQWLLIFSLALLPGNFHNAPFTSESDCEVKAAELRGAGAEAWCFNPQAVIDNNQMALVLATLLRTLDARLDTIEQSVGAMRESVQGAASGAGIALGN